MRIDGRPIQLGNRVEHENMCMYFIALGRHPGPMGRLFFMFLRHHGVERVGRHTRAKRFASWRFRLEDAKAIFESEKPPASSSQLV